MKALLIGAAAGLVAMLALMPVAGDALDQLAEARAERAWILALADEQGERAIVPPGVGMSARDAAAATAALVARVRALAGKGGVLVEDAAAVPGGGLARVRLRVSGSEDAVIAFADGIERGRPLARFATWSLAADGSVVRLSGELVAPWG